MKTYKNPINGHKETDGGRLCWLWCFLFSGMYFAFRGNWGWFFLAYMLTFATFFTSLLVLRKGYREVQS